MGGYCEERRVADTLLLRNRMVWGDMVNLLRGYAFDQLFEDLSFIKKSYFPSAAPFARILYAWIIAQ